MIGPDSIGHDGHDVSARAVNTPPTVGGDHDALNTPQDIVMQLQNKMLAGKSLSPSQIRQLFNIINSPNNATSIKRVIWPMLLNLSYDQLRPFMASLLSMVSSSFTDGDTPFFYIDGMIDTINNLIQNNPSSQYIDAFRSLLKEMPQKQKNAIKTNVNTIIAGLENIAPSDESPPLAMTINDPLIEKGLRPMMPNSANMDVIGPSNMMQLSGLNETEPLTVDKGVVATRDSSIKIESLGNTIKTDVSITNQHSTMPSPDKEAYAQARGSIRYIQKIDNQMPLAAIVQIGNIQPMLFISPVVNQIMVPAGQSVVSDDHMYKLAIVTDGIASLRDIDEVDYIRKVRHEGGGDGLPYKLYSQYKELYEEGYHAIISLHLNPNLNTSYRSAMAAKKEIDDQNVGDLEINVYNTNANGVGLGLMIYELNQTIKNGASPREVNQLARQLIAGYRHWVCPLETNFSQNHAWVTKLANIQKKMQMQFLNHVPVIELDGVLSITQIAPKKEVAMAILVNQIRLVQQKKRKKINRICVEYQGQSVFRDAIKIRHQIKDMYPSVQVSLKSVGRLTRQFFGDELVGVCII